MNAPTNLLIIACLSYGLLLFGIAFAAERAAAQGRGAWLRTPVVYTLSLSIYCTAWTFYGAVGYAARSGMEFVTIYLGPSLVMIGWWWGLRKLVRVARAQRVTSVADLISARFGKSQSLALLVTVMSVIGVTPYIALQLQSVSESFAVFAGIEARGSSTGFWVAFGLALFTLLFGTRKLNTNEQHDGVVIAIALEAVVKLLALLAVGAFVVWGIAGGIGPMLARIDASPLADWQVTRSRWAVLTLLSAAAFLCLPRMFQVLVVENNDERHIQVAAWAFPIYLLLMSLFVVPIAVVGLDLLPAGANPDLFVLTLPMAEGRTGLAVFSFLGGFSSATSMVIVATLALPVVGANHIVTPIWLQRRQSGASQSGDIRNLVILSRRLSVLGIIALGYFYYQISGGSAALAAIGLISFAGVAQFLPAMLGGIFWRGATRAGAFAGLVVGFLLWVYCSFLPAFGPGGALPEAWFSLGPGGLSWLRPTALFGIEGIDPTVHAVLWSLSMNLLVFVLVSLVTFPHPLERLQGAQFVNVFTEGAVTTARQHSAATSEDLMIMTQRILGADEAQAFFRAEAQRQALPGHIPEATPDFLERLERELAASVGVAAAHAMVSQISGSAAVSVEDLLAVADESAQILEYSNQLEVKSAELAQTASQLRKANAQLTQLSEQKDAFLSQVSHELRTPMTSIRSFSEILRDTDELTAAEKTKYGSIIHDEAVRLTRLLDDLLDLSVLENGQVSLNLSTGSLSAVLDHSVKTAERARSGYALSITRDASKERVDMTTDMDRLGQVFVNLITNAQKYCDAPAPHLEISVKAASAGIEVHFLDNGTPIPAAAHDNIFEKFARLEPGGKQGAGLGLAICREIMTRLGGSITFQPEAAGNRFVVFLPSETQG